MLRFPASPPRNHVRFRDSGREAQFRNLFTLERGRTGLSVVPLIHPFSLPKRQSCMKSFTSLYTGGLHILRTCRFAPQCPLLTFSSSSKITGVTGSRDGQVRGTSSHRLPRWRYAYLRSLQRLWSGCPRQARREVHPPFRGAGKRREGPRQGVFTQRRTGRSIGYLTCLNWRSGSTPVKQDSGLDERL